MKSKKDNSSSSSCTLTLPGGTPNPGTPPAL
eukprot:CAMPEP_0201913520 /NCGR_PEP_ID=MMETSP0903-20130614/3951_1 /ASSEMBLY_ACC=CAM_ASM_000552 /TAXON_ID=420261 /ORGANISM="Thalassiosira antarctica, Strain CCMP982" /LENGTH=30 /DNA_ID= /DNA_START= /DNA_END= /DNA_ORIENTATION=